MERHAQRRAARRGRLPVLSNIYLDRLDEFVENDADPGIYPRGTGSNPDYRNTSDCVTPTRRARKSGTASKARELRSKQARLPSGDCDDPGYRRLRYVRYADDTLLGFTGPKAEAEEIKRRLATFLRDELQLELSADEDPDHPRPHRRGAVPRL